MIGTECGVFAVNYPNSVMEGEGFYVSHNDRDLVAYGSQTTALIVGQMEKFYILKGDHRAGYVTLIPRGFATCLDYFKRHSDLVHRYSDKPPT
jgi:hypothetical protein